MTIGQYVENIIFFIGCLAVAVVLLRTMWYLVRYTFLRGDDQERAHQKKALLRTTITFMFLMIIWAIVASLEALV
ncbi:MAG: hypothetical protein ACREGH_03275 [Minisyncoccia bacterium]